MMKPYSEYKQIDDIIDDRKKLGQYNIGKQPNAINYRYHYSTSDKFIRFDDDAATPSMYPNEGDFLSSSDVKNTDSEITLVRVRCDGPTYKRRPSTWSMNDIAVPGDGSHLAESPSLVNLATLVQQNDEYLVPLSSWDPYCSDNVDAISNVTSKVSEGNTTISSRNSASSSRRRQSISERISNFLRRHCKKSKTLPEPAPKE